MQRVRWWVAALAAALVLFAGTTGVVHAITHGQPDGGNHPYVGLAVFADAAGTPLWRCSGTLISPTIFLTAGHCTEAPAAHATIWFESDVDALIQTQIANGDPPSQMYPFGGPTTVSGTPYTHPLFDPNAFFLHDLGVVELDAPHPMAAYGVLPTQGVLDALATRRGRQDTTFTAVGYGLQRINPVFVQGQRIRLTATLNLVDLNGTAGIPAGTSVMLSGNAHTGGTCFGDSGGPLFLNASNVVAAVTSFGLNGNCAGVGGGYRVDTADDLGWLYGTFGSQLPTP
jgi:hypothetical protein